MDTRQIAELQKRLRERQREEDEARRRRLQEEEEEARERDALNAVVSTAINYSTPDTSSYTPDPTPDTSSWGGFDGGSSGGGGASGDF